MMLSWLLIIFLLLVGFTLVLVEVLFVPGTTIVGIFGLLFMAGGIYSGFEFFGDTVGYSLLVISSIATIVAVIYSFKSGVWKKFSLQGANKSHVNEERGTPVKVGDEGLTISSLRPSGKAEFGGEVWEVKTFGQYLGPDQRIKVVSVKEAQIVVESIN